MQHSASSFKKMEKKKTLNGYFTTNQSLEFLRWTGRCPLGLRCCSCRESMPESASAVHSFGVPHQTSLGGVSSFSCGTPVALPLPLLGSLHLQQVRGLGATAAAQLVRPAAGLAQRWHSLPHPASAAQTKELIFLMLDFFFILNFQEWCYLDLRNSHFSDFI